VILHVAGPDEVEVQCNVPELGQGRDEALRNALVASTGLPAEAFTIAWADSARIGPGASMGAPVDAAARAAGRELARAGGALAEIVGLRFSGEDGLGGPPNLAATVVTLGDDGQAVGVLTAVLHGDAQDPRLVANLAEGGAHMGLGVAVSEEVVTTEGLADGRFRVLGVLKPKGCPPFSALAVNAGGASRAIAEVVVNAVPAAVGVAVAAAEGGLRARLPMKDCGVARGLGVKPPK
jgi:hypothetical protein